MPLPPTLRDYQNLSPQQWVDRASRTVPRMLVLLLIVAIAWQLVQLTWLILDRGDESAAVVNAPTPTFVNPRKPIDVQAIANAHLFGTTRAEVVDSSNAPPAQTNLILAGTWAGEDPAQGYAFIGESANTAKMYGVGKVVRGSTKLHAVYAEKVILETNGRLETLSLPRLGTGAAAGLVAARPPPPTRPQPSQFAENLRRVAETNPTAFAEIVRPQPVFANGQQRGYRVYPGRQRQQFSRLGFQPGDLVLSINGTPLDDPQRGMEIFSTLSASDKVSVTVERNGQSQELTLNTATISLPEPSPSAPPNGGAASSPPPAAPQE
jgi:general secretion pathway protein C